MMSQTCMIIRFSRCVRSEIEYCYVYSLRRVSDIPIRTPHVLAILHHLSAGILITRVSYSVYPSLRPSLSYNLIISIIPVNVEGNKFKKLLTKPSTSVKCVNILRGLLLNVTAESSLIPLVSRISRTNTRFDFFPCKNVITMKKKSSIIPSDY